MNHQRAKKEYLIDYLTELLSETLSSKVVVNDCGTVYVCDNNNNCNNEIIPISDNLIDCNGSIDKDGCVIVTSSNNNHTDGFTDNFITAVNDKDKNNNAVVVSERRAKQCSTEQCLLSFIKFYFIFSKTAHSHHFPKHQILENYARNTNPNQQPKHQNINKHYNQEKQFEYNAQKTKDRIVIIQSFTQMKNLIFPLQKIYHHTT
mmetsp:Transcript_16/g.17  ORF Transcript_16/g.17 Transcript_16/m.17 type:complete len:204 (+) Transcript_16:394-1005(+)